MPRQPRCRCIYGYPDHWSFSPDDGESLEEVVLALDEYEAVRLIDHENLTQEQCARQMEVSRTTVTAIYDSARKKIADAIVCGKRLVISGGCYRLSPVFSAVQIEKGEHVMRVAVTYEDGEIFQHFGHTAQFKLYDVQDGKIVDERVVDTNGAGHGALAGFLKQVQADVLICGGIGMGAQNARAEAGVKLYGGASGSADEAVKAYLAGNLDYNPDVTCSHHDHGEGHSCGEHEGGCSERSCH